MRRRAAAWAENEVCQGSDAEDKGEAARPMISRSPPVSPILFTVPGTDWEVSAYGFFLGLALVAGWLVSVSFAARDRLPADRLGTSYVVAVAFGLVGARAWWLVQHPDAWAGPASLLALQQGGLSAAAGVTIAALFALLHTSRMRVPTLAWLDAVAPALALGVAMERIGALLAGSGYGRYAPGFPLALRFPEGSPAFLEHRRELAQLLGAGATESLPVYPTQIIGFALAVLALAIGLRIRARRRYGGQVFLVVASLLLAARSLVEDPLRADQGDALLGPFTGAQLAALAVIAVLAGIARARSARVAIDPKGMRPWEGGPWSPPAPREGTP